MLKSGSIPRRQGRCKRLLAVDQALQIGPEIYALAPFDDLFSDASTVAEALLGAKLRAGNVVVGLAAGPGITDGPGTADLRARFSVAFVRDERVLDRDADRLDDDEDRCPDEPGLTDDGCPLPDGDRDTVPDASDACPTQPGLVSADPVHHGCPPPGPGPLPFP